MLFLINLMIADIRRELHDLQRLQDSVTGCFSLDVNVTISKGILSFVVQIDNATLFIEM